MQMIRRVRLLLPFTLLLTTPALADVITVDPDGGADFDDLQLAIDAAQDGDILRLGSGIYTTGTPSLFIISNKDVRIVGAETPLPVFWDGFRIQDLAAGKTVTLSSLNYHFDSLYIDDCEGAVRLQDLAPVRDAQVKNSDNVVFTRCHLQGHTGDDAGTPGDGLVVDNSNVAVFSCTLIAGNADQTPAILNDTAPDGGAGCRVINDGFVYLADSTLEGGDGGNGHVADFLDPPVDGGNGGNGLRVEHGEAIVIDSPRSGGAAGMGGDCAPFFPGCGTPGVDGLPGDDTVVVVGPDPTALTDIPGNARTAEIATWVEDTDQIDVIFHGEPDDLVYLPAQATTAFFYDAMWKGVWTQPSSAVQPVGTIPASGTLMVTVDLPSTLTCDGVMHFLQAAFLAPLPGGQFDRFIATPVALSSFTPPAEFPLTNCSANVNSTGQVAQVSGSGSPNVVDEDLSFAVDSLPLNKFGYFLMSQSQGFVPLFGNSQGNLCIGSPLVRFAGNVLNSGGTGTVAFEPDFGNLPSGVTFAANDTWFFQYWYRDSNPGSTSNTTQAVEVSFCP